MKEESSRNAYDRSVYAAMNQPRFLKFCAQMSDGAHLNQVTTYPKSLLNMQKGSDNSYCMDFNFPNYTQIDNSCKFIHTFQNRFMKNNIKNSINSATDFPKALMSEINTDFIDSSDFGQRSSHFETLQGHNNIHNDAHFCANLKKTLQRQETEVLNGVMLQKIHDPSFSNTNSLLRPARKRIQSTKPFVTISTSKNFKVFIGNIPPKVSNTAFVNIVSKFGRIEKLSYRPSNVFWAFAIVMYADDDSLKRCVWELHGKRIFDVPHYHFLVCCSIPPDAKISEENENEVIESSHGATASSVIVDTVPKTFTLLRDGPPGSNLFVYGIPAMWNEIDLMQLCSKYGHIVGIRVPRSHSKYKNFINRGFGFVSYDSKESAFQAFRELAGIFICGKKLKMQLKNGEDHLLPRELSKLADSMLSCCKTPGKKYKERQHSPEHVANFYDNSDSHRNAHLNCERNGRLNCYSNKSNDSINTVSQHLAYRPYTNLSNQLHLNNQNCAYRKMSAFTENEKKSFQPSDNTRVWNYFDDFNTVMRLPPASAMLNLYGDNEIQSQVDFQNDLEKKTKSYIGNYNNITGIIQPTDSSTLSAVATHAKLDVSPNKSLVADLNSVEDRETDVLTTLNFENLAKEFEQTLKKLSYNSDRNVFGQNCEFLDIKSKTYDDEIVADSNIQNYFTPDIESKTHAESFNKLSFNDIHSNCDDGNEESYEFCDIASVIDKMCSSDIDAVKPSILQASPTIQHAQSDLGAPSLNTTEFLSSAESSFHASFGASVVLGHDDEHSDASTESYGDNDTVDTYVRNPSFSMSNKNDKKFHDAKKVTESLSDTHSYLPTSLWL